MERRPGDPRREMSLVRSDSRPVPSPLHDLRKRRARAAAREMADHPQRNLVQLEKDKTSSSGHSVTSAKTARSPKIPPFLPLVPYTASGTPHNHDVPRRERGTVFPYLAMLAVPGFFALTGMRRAGVVLLVVSLLYWLMIGFRFQVGMDWNNYIFIYEMKKSYPLTRLLFDREPGYGALIWLTGQLGWSIIFINAVSALVFCWGMFSVARRCREPWIAIVIATP